MIEAIFLMANSEKYVIAKSGKCVILALFLNAFGGWHE
jgi:hypothetical protein